MIRVLYLRPNAPISEISLHGTADRIETEIEQLLGTDKQARILVTGSIYLLINGMEQLRKKQPNFTIDGRKIYGPALIVKTDTIGRLTDLMPHEVTLLRWQFGRSRL